jgi:hypothetical protein
MMAEIGLGHVIASRPTFHIMTVPGLHAHKQELPDVEIIIGGSHPAVPERTLRVPPSTSS